MECFIGRNGKTLRPGYTTGTCAALAARAAVRMLLTGKNVSVSSLITPKGTPVEIEIHDARVSAAEATCAVRKDAGDDPDVTDGILVYATARRGRNAGVTIDGGDGVGRVTRPGLDQPVGAAAINRVPRMMIEREVLDVCGELGHDGGIAVTIAIPGGEALAAGTFNPKLGVVGGLSVIGTSGVVEPMSSRAFVDAMRVEMNVVRSEGADGLILTPGNYGEAFLRAMPAIARRPHVKCSNFVGEAIDAAAALGFGEILVVGHIGKLIKLAGGIMDTHSRVADCRLDLLALHAALAGMEPGRLHRVLAATTVDDGLDMLGALRSAAVASLLERAEAHVAGRAGDQATTGVVVFSQRSGLLGMSKGADHILARWENGVV